MKARKSSQKAPSKRTAPASAAPSTIIPPRLRGFVERRVHQGGFPSEKAYVCYLVEEDRRAMRELVRKVREGVESEAGVEIGSKAWRTLRQELAARRSTRRKAG